MTLWEAIFIGLIQGASEFLPISSDGHLVLVPTLFNLAEPDLNLISIVHQGTLLAVLVYFRRDLWAIIKAFLRGLARREPLVTTEARLGWYILVGTIPAAIIGLTLKDFFEAMFASPTVAAVLLLVNAAILIAGERVVSGEKQLEQMTWFDAGIIGLFQVIALFPGLSRSGSTIATGLWRGLDRSTAAHFSFLLGIPAILGAGLLAAVDILAADNLRGELPTFTAAFLAAAISGYSCIHFLLSWLRRRNLYIFAAYCIAFGLFYLLTVWL